MRGSKTEYLRIPVGCDSAEGRRRVNKSQDDVTQSEPISFDADGSLNHVSRRKSIQPRAHMDVSWLDRIAAGRIGDPWRVPAIK